MPAGQHATPSSKTCVTVQLATAQLLAGRSSRAGAIAGQVGIAVTTEGNWCEQSALHICKDSNIASPADAMMDKATGQKAMQ